MKPAWLDNDSLFRAECQKGHAWERWAAKMFYDVGFEVQLVEQKIRNSVEERHPFKSSVDLFVNKMPIEIKSRNESFDTVIDPIFVTSTHKWSAMEPKPFAVVMIFRNDLSVWAIPGLMVERLPIQNVHDKVRDVRYKAYVARKNQWRPIERLFDALRQGS